MTYPIAVGAPADKQQSRQCPQRCRARSRGSPVDGVATLATAACEPLCPKTLRHVGMDRLTDSTATKRGARGRGNAAAPRLNGIASHRHSPNASIADTALLEMTSSSHTRTCSALSPSREHLCGDNQSLRFASRCSDNNRASDRNWASDRNRSRDCIERGATFGCCSVGI